MLKRKEINDKLTAWILNKVKTEYADDISLVLLYGSYVNGTAGCKSDVDCYFIPKTERGYHLAVTFILEGVGYDLFPVSWERAERIADLQESLLPLIGDVHILYCNCPEDAQRFAALQERLKRNLADDACVRKTAAGKCGEAGRLLALLNQEHKTSELWKTVGTLIMTLADAVAINRHDYYHRGLKKQFEDLRNNFPGVPRKIPEGYRNVVEADSIGEAIEYAQTLYQDVCDYLGIPCSAQKATETEAFPEGRMNAAWLAGLYEEICSTFNKIYVCCETGNHILAFLSAVCLQRELDDAKEAGCPTYDLLGGFHHKALPALSERTRSIERDLVRLIENNGGQIKQYESFQQFAAAKW